MRTISLLLTFCTAFMLFETSALCANKKKEGSIEDFKKIQKTFEIDDNGNITYMKVIELDGISKDEIYLRAKNYFIYNYNSGKSVMQTEDKEKGVLIGKGMYKNVYIGSTLFFTHAFDTWHILRIDVKEGRVRIVLSLVNYDVTTKSSSKDPGQIKEVRISDTYPINESFDGSKKLKNIYLQTFLVSHKKATNAINGIERAIKEGNTSSDIENEDW